MATKRTSKAVAGAKHKARIGARKAAAGSAGKAAKPASRKTVTAPKTARASAKRVAKPVKKTAGSRPRLLAGGNPQIPKGEGEAPVRAYIRAMPGWKRAVGTRLDRLVDRVVPGVRKAVKWNSPFYGAQDAEGWFLSFHCFDRYIKVTFFRGRSLHPVPPEESRVKDTRYVHLREGEAFDERQLADWVKQASRLPGERM